jgi:hypothetical protein
MGYTLTHHHGLSRQAHPLGLELAYQHAAYVRLWLSHGDGAFVSDPCLPIIGTLGVGPACCAGREHTCQTG